MRSVLVIIFIFFGSVVFADNLQEYCEGYEMGFKTAYGNNNVAVPACPAPIAASAGETYYQNGLKDGMKEGNKRKLN